MDALQTNDLGRILHSRHRLRDVSTVMGLKLPTEFRYFAGTRQIGWGRSPYLIGLLGGSLYVAEIREPVLV